MGEAIVLSWETHSAHLLEGLWHQFLSNYNTDFEIVLKNDEGVTTSVKAHHLVLSVFCPNLDSTQKTMNLDENLDISKEDIQCLMEFIYSGTIKVTGDRLKQLKDGANAIGLTIMVEMIDNINSNKLLEVCPEEHESTVLDPPVPKRKRKTCTTAAAAGIEVTQKRPRRQQTTSNEVPMVVSSDAVKSCATDSSSVQTSDQNKQKKLGKRPYRKLLSKDPIVQVVDKNTEDTSEKDGELSQPSNVDENVVEPTRQRTATKNSSQNSSNEKIKPQQTGRRKRQKKMLLEIDPEEAEQSKLINDEQSQEDNGSSAAINDQYLKEDDTEETYDMSSPEGRSYWMKQMIVKVTNQRRKHWTCDLCGQSRDGWYRQLSHIRCHMNPDQLLKCPHCDFVAEMTFDLNRHLATKHSVENPLEKIKCPYCEFICDKKAQLEAHQKAEHPNQFVCDECTDAFPTRHKLMSHKLVKHGRRSRANPRHVLPKPNMATLLILT